MNVVDLWKHMKVSQTASSPNDPDKIYKSDYALHWNNENGSVVELIANVLHDDEWIVDIEWVDFWTAYNAAKEEGWTILSEHKDFPTALQDGTASFEQYEIDGKWQILNR